MKNLRLISTLFILVTFILSSCDKDEDKEDPNARLITIASVRPIFDFVDILEYNNSYNNPKTTEVPYYFMKPHDDEGWSKHWGTASYIKNFVHEEGYEYLLQITTITILECIEYETVLIKEISKTKKDSENIPLQRKSITIASKQTGNEAYPYHILRGDKWIKFPNIEGFDSEYEEGYEYEIEIDCKYNGANASPKYSFIFSNTTKKEKKESEGL